MQTTKNKIVKCPNCSKVMKEKEYFTLDAGYGMVGEEVYNKNVEYDCSDCKVSCKNGEWIIPPDLQPTAKQKKTLLFINSRLGSNFTPITKRQCWDIISKNLEKAKKVPQRHWYNGITDEDCDELGLDASFFY